MRRLLLLPLLLCVVSVSGCTQTSYGCTGNTCKVMIEGDGQVDLVQQFGGGANIALQALRPDAADITVAGRSATLRVGQTQRIGRLAVTLTSIEGEQATFRVVGQRR